MEGWWENWFSDLDMDIDKSFNQCQRNSPRRLGGSDAATQGTRSSSETQDHIMSERFIQLSSIIPAGFNKEFGDDEEFLRDIILQQPVTYSGSSLSSSNEMDGSDCFGKKVHNPSTTLSNSTPRTFILSFDKSTIIPATTTITTPEDEKEEEEPRIKSRSCGNKRSLELPKVKVSSNSKKSEKKSRSDSQCLDHIMAERKRRLEIAQKFIALSATIPGLKKTDKSSILCEAINYVKLLQERVKELEEEEEDPNKTKTKESTIRNDNFDVKARVLGNEVLIEMQCEKENGIELKILNLLENLHLIVTASSVFPFGNSTLGFTIVTQMGDGYNMTMDDLVKTLRQQVALRS